MTQSSPTFTPAALKSRGALIGVEPSTNVHVIENHDAALPLWRAAGLRRQPLLHVDAHPDMAWVPEEGFINIANFLCQALREGLVSDLYWIVPDACWADPAGRIKIVEYMRALINRYPGAHPRPQITDDAAAFNALGHLIQIRPLGRLPRYDTPVLLDIDLDFLFISRLPDTHGQPPAEQPWCYPETLIEALRAQGVRSIFTTVALSVEGGYTPLRWKFLGRELAEALRNPNAAATNLPMRQFKRQAAIAFADGRFSEAAAIYRQLAAQDPNDAASLFGLAEALTEGGDAQSGAAWYLRAINEDSAYDIRRDRIALQYFENGQLAKAEQCCRRALRLAADSAIAEYVLGLIAVKHNNTAQAEAALLNALMIDPSFIDARIALGDLYQQLKRDEEAIAAYEQALALGLTTASTLDELFITSEESPEHRIGPAHVELHRKLASLYAQCNRSDDAAFSLKLWEAAQL